MQTVTFSRPSFRLKSRNGEPASATLIFDLSEKLPDGYYVKSAVIQIKEYQMLSSTPTGSLNMDVQDGTMQMTWEAEIGTAKSPCVTERKIFDLVTQKEFGKYPSITVTPTYTNDTPNYEMVSFESVSIIITYEEFAINCDIPSSFTAGESFTLSPVISRPDATYNITFNFESNKASFGTGGNYGDSSTITIPVSWAQYITDEMNGSVAVNVSASATAQGGTSTTKKWVYQDAVTRTVKFNRDDLIPTISAVSVTPVKNVLNDDTVYIVNRELKAITTHALKYGATIRSFIMNDGKSRYNLSSISDASWSTVFTESSSGAKTLTFTLTDSRGLVARFTKDITITNYEAPKISSCYVQRCNASAVPDDTGDYLFAYIAYTYTPFTYQTSKTNAASCALAYAVNNTSTPTYISSGTIDSGVQTKVSSGVLQGDDSYLVRFRITDALTTVEKIVTVEAAAYTMHFQAGGKAVWVGDSSNGKPQKSFGVSSNWASYLLGGIYFGGEFDGATYKNGCKLSNAVGACHAYTATILSSASNWHLSVTGGYYQTITIDGLLETDAPLVDVNLDVLNYTQAEAAMSAMSRVYRATASLNTLTVYSSESSLDTDVPIKLLVIRKLIDEPTEVSSGG